MFIYTLAESTKTYGDGHTAMLLTITDKHTGETRTCDDFTYFEEGEDTQAALAELWEQMTQTVYVLMLQGTGDDEYAYETGGVFSTREAAVAKADAINAEYEDDDFEIEYEIEEHVLNG